MVTTSGTTGGDAAGAGGGSTTSGGGQSTAPDLDSIQLRSGEQGWNTDGVLSLTKKYDGISSFLRNLKGRMDKYEDFNPCQYGKKDQTWKSFSEGRNGQPGFYAGVKNLNDSLESLATSIDSLGKNLDATAKSAAKTEEANVEGAAKMGQQLRGEDATATGTSSSGTGTGTGTGTVYGGASDAGYDSGYDTDPGRSKR